MVLNQLQAALLHSDHLAHRRLRHFNAFSRTLARVKRRIHYFGLFIILVLSIQPFLTLLRLNHFDSALNFGFYLILRDHCVFTELGNKGALCL